MRRAMFLSRPSVLRVSPIPAFGARYCAAGKEGKPGHVARKSDVADVVEALERDPELIQALVNTMTPESRRRLVVTGGAYEWFGRDSVPAEVLRADFDKDRKICPKDFDKWFESALRRKSDIKDEIPAKPTTSGQQIVHRVAFSALAMVALEAGLPFVGFGFLDNATMILAGDAIDRSVGFYLNCSVMASAAMGNIVSGCMGMQVHGFVEKLVQRLNLPIPPLSEDERRSQPVFLAGHIGGTLGIAIGLSLGLLPLLFISDDDEKAEHRAFHAIDADNDGHITVAELRKVLGEVGILVPDEAADRIMHKFGSNGQLNFEQFKTLCETVRRDKTVAYA